MFRISKSLICIEKKKRYISLGSRERAKKLKIFWNLRICNDFNWITLEHTQQIIPKINIQALNERKVWVWVQSENGIINKKDLLKRFEIYHFSNSSTFPWAIYNSCLKYYFSLWIQNLLYRSPQKTKEFYEIVEKIQRQSQYLSFVNFESELTWNKWLWVPRANSLPNLFQKFFWIKSNEFDQNRYPLHRLNNPQVLLFETLDFSCKVSFFFSKKKFILLFEKEIKKEEVNNTWWYLFQARSRHISLQYLSPLCDFFIKKMKEMKRRWKKNYQFWRQGVIFKVELSNLVSNGISFGSWFISWDSSFLNDKIKRKQWAQISFFVCSELLFKIKWSWLEIN